MLFSLMLVLLRYLFCSTQVLEERLKKELEEWKANARKILAEWDSIKTKYSQVEKDHAVMLRDIEVCQKQKDDCRNKFKYKTFNMTFWFSKIRQKIDANFVGHIEVGDDEYRKDILRWSSRQQQKCCTH